MYVGPETMLPLASALAGVTGAALLFWRRIVRRVRAGWRRLTDAVERRAEGG